jgi:hypothetical protein
MASAHDGVTAIAPAVNWEYKTLRSWSLFITVRKQQPKLVGR